MNDRDKIEELEETVRQQRELLAPPCAFPLEWKLSPTQSRLLGALCRSGELTTEAATISAGVDGEATSQEVVRQHVCRMRVKLKRHGIHIGRTYSVGYYLEPDSLRAARVAFRPALRVEN